jgi:hypothetical protein
MLNHAGFGDDRREVGNRSDDAPRLDGARDGAARIDPFETGALERPAVTLEEPPRNAVLCADHDRLGPEQRRQPRRQVRQAVSLDAEKHDVGRADGCQIARHRRVDLEIAIGAEHPQAPGFHGPQVGAAREQRHVVSGARQAGADVAADCPGAGNDDVHDGSPAYAAATRRR